MNEIINKRVSISGRNPDHELKTRYILPEKKVPLQEEAEKEKVNLRQFPIKTLPERVQAIANDYKESLGTQLDFVVAPMLSAVAAAAGANAVVHYGQYKNPANLWICVVGRSGTNKSAPMEQLLEPLQKKQSAMYGEYEKNYNAFCSAGAKGLPPCQKQLIISDTTAEARMQALAFNPRGVLMYRDELNGFFDDLGRYSKGGSGEVTTLLSVFSNKPISYARKTARDLRVEFPVMNIIGGTQPGVVTKVFGNEQFMLNGLNHRFVFFYPELGIFDYEEPKAVSAENAAAWEQIIDKIYLVCSQPRHFTYDNEALGFLKTYYTTETYALNQADSEYEQEMRSKFFIILHRVALVLHLLTEAAKLPANNEFASQISKSTIMNAYNVCFYLIKCSLEVARTIGAIVPPDEEVRSLLEGRSKKEIAMMLKARFPEKKQSEIADFVGAARSVFRNN